MQVGEERIKEEKRERKRVIIVIVRRILVVNYFPYLNFNMTGVLFQTHKQKEDTHSLVESPESKPEVIHWAGGSKQQIFLL